MDQDKYRVLIVDDEFLARKLLKGYVSKIDSLELVADCSSAFEAITILQKDKIDILLLDIHMPDLTGLELVESMKNFPAVIFTTAYSEYAINSYELGAVDYLLKPIGFPRFFQAINKAIDQIGRNSSGNNLSSKVSNTEESSTTAEETLSIKPTADFLTVKADYKIYKINFSDLLYIEGQHEYVTFHTVSRRITALYSLKNLEEQLPNEQFIRIHKSYIVSFHHIQDIEGNTVNVAGSKIPIGGSYRDILMERLNLK
ncbi:MAG: LytTR family DNA-binding domain-containing protein [Bacteroidales bacterium]|nr:LytTR family DNA-binding domain-containing protein [Bacteroidales bacterium]